MRRYDLTFNGKACGDFGVLLYDYPKFEGATKNYTSTLIAGRAGALVSRDLSVGNLTVRCTFAVIGEAFTPVIRKLRSWLSGTGKLYFSDTPETFFKVLKIEYSSIEREIRRYGRFTVTFVCTPYEFREDGQLPVTFVPKLYNPYDACSPIYRIKGNGECTLTVNGKRVRALVNGNLTIDTELLLSYREDGTLQNTAVTGDYEDLRIKTGEAEISVASGFSLAVLPNWGYIV